MDTYHAITTQADIDRFLSETNDLHDGYIISVQYHNDGITPIPGGHEFHYENTQLRVQILVTSVYDSVVELLFTGMYEWQIRDEMWDITETAISFTKHNQIIWTSGYSTAPDVRKRYCYAVANSMQWRFV